MTWAEVVVVVMQGSITLYVARSLYRVARSLRASLQAMSDRLDRLERRSTGDG